jgi:hypothetical protein
VYLTGCPNVVPMRELLKRCLVRLGLDPSIIEVETGAMRTGDRYRRLPSPTVLVDGVDVLGEDVGAAASCRLRLPTEQELLSALGGRDEK